jgi:hypothetical protein
LRRRRTRGRRGRSGARRFHRRTGRLNGLLSHGSRLSGGGGTGVTRPLCRSRSRLSSGTLRDRGWSRGRRSGRTLSRRRRCNSRIGAQESVRGGWTLGHRSRWGGPV